MSARKDNAFGQITIYAILQPHWHCSKPFVIEHHLSITAARDDLLAVAGGQEADTVDACNMPLQGVSGVPENVHIDKKPGVAEMQMVWTGN